MKCPQCNTQNKTGQIYCRACGQQLDLTYDQIHDAVHDQIDDDRREYYQDQTRSLMVVALFFLVVSILLNMVAGPIPERVTTPELDMPGVEVPFHAANPVHPFQPDPGSK